MRLSFLRPGRPLSKKPTHCWWLINLFLIALGCLSFQKALAQTSPAEEQRLEVLERQLEALAVDSTARGLNETVNFSVSNVSLQEFVRALAETHRLNISIDPGLEGRVTNNFNNARVSKLIIFLCREYKLDIRFTGNILSFIRYVPPPEPKPVPLPKEIRLQYDEVQNRLSLDLTADTLSQVARRITQVSRKNIVLAPGVGNQLISGYVEAMPFEAALDKIAYANNLKFFKSKDDAYIFYPEEPASGSGQTAGGANGNPASPGNPSMPGNFNSAGNYNNGSNDNRPPGKGSPGLNIDTQKGGDGKVRLSVDGVNVPIQELIHQVSTRLGINYVVYTPVPGNTTLKVQNVSYEAFMEFLLQGTTHTFRVMEGIYLIGERNLEGLRTSKLVRMQFRPAVKLDEIIPADLKKGVEIKVFPDLNSIILAGSTPQIEEIAEFLKILDQPVVNVLIEVIVMDVRKGYSIRTGIRAFTSDSTQRTGGQLFPGLDVTLGAGSINNFLNRLDINGYVNLGRVTPNFYLQLQALETNNAIRIRSTPKLATLNGHEADLTIGRSEYYLEQTQNIVGGVNPITSVGQQFKQVQANLNIKINPVVSGNDDITLGISAEFSDFIPPTLRGAPPGNATRKFTSNIRVKNEEMIVLGGLEEARREKGGSGFPLLSRIPVLKWLFSSRTDVKVNNRLIVFIKPTIVY
jgi:type IV pilus assembly protein PilQ